MFSSTMMASSMTMPVESDSPSMVRLLRVKPAMRMAVKVAMIEHGMASAATKAGRSFFTDRKKIMVTTMAAPVTLMRSSGSPGEEGGRHRGHDGDERPCSPTTAAAR